MYRTTESDNCIPFAGAIHGQRYAVPAGVVVHEQNREARFGFHLDGRVGANFERAVAAEVFELDIQVGTVGGGNGQLRRRFCGPIESFGLRGGDPYGRIELQTNGSGEAVLEADGESAEGELQTHALDHGRIQFVTHVAQAADDGFEHLLDFDRALLQLRRPGTEVEAEGIELQADGAEHLTDFVMQETRDSAVIGFAFGDKAEEQLIQSFR